jgi:hypothetical protein
MGVANTSAQERALNSLKAFTAGAPTPWWNIKTHEIVPEIPETPYSLWYKQIYEEALSRYQQEKGLLLNETV